MRRIDGWPSGPPVSADTGNHLETSGPNDSIAQGLNMETANVTSIRSALKDSPRESPEPLGRAADGALAVTAQYLLSEAGRKASLLAGGSGRALQQQEIQVTATRMHLVSVDRDGVARRKLRPRFERDPRRGIVRVDEPPVYDAPPTIDQLFAAAAQNYQLEREYQSDRSARRAQRLEQERDFRAATAQAFFADTSQRALVHPAPSPRRCYVETERGRIMFDSSTDEGRAAELPAEAHRRFRADLRGRRDRLQQEHAAQRLVHEEKKQFAAEWISQHGTAEQKDRLRAGMLPLDEAIAAITDHVFASCGHTQYVKDGLARLQAHLRSHNDYRDAEVAPNELGVTTTAATKATAGQWELVKALQSEMPDATVTLRVHRLMWKRVPQAPSLTIASVLVTRKLGPLTLRREYLTPE